MRTRTTLIFSTLLLFCFFNLKSQKPIGQRPKVGLCLSGGAAKGIAHISLLKAIDSLGIKVDYITGTSMGSIMGGLYAIGYSGKDLENIVLTINWDKVLTNAVSLNDINIEEKDEYGRYAIELPFSRGNIRLPFGVIEGQNLMALLQRYTFKAIQTPQFSDLPIPFKCVGADAVKGEAVMLDSGNLALALRTSMAIPTVFTPVERGEMLLVDGGVVKNFPVDKVKEMGADKVIGSYTGGTLYDRQNINNFIKILYQTASHARLAESEAQKKNCDILLDFDKCLLEIKAGVADFRKTREILKASDKVVAEMLPQLEELANEQKKYAITEGVQRFNHLISNDSVKADAIEIVELDQNSGETTLINRHDYTQGGYISRSEIENQVSYLYGTHNYSKIYYTLERNGGNAPIIRLNAVSLPKSVFKIGLHYDSELGTGIIVNATLRDVLGNFSRAFASVDLSESPKMRLDYHKRLGWSSYWLNANSYFETVNSSVYFEGKNLEDYRRTLVSNYFSINKRLRQDANISFGYYYERVGYKPRVSATNRAFLGEATDTLIQLSLYNYTQTGLQMQYQVNTLNARAFPTKGLRINAIARLPLNAHRNSDLTFVANNNIVNVIKQSDKPGRQYFLAVFHGQLVQPLHKKVQLIADLSMGKYFNIESKPSDEELAVLFGVGGVESRNSFQLVPFWGYREGYSLHSTFVTTRLSVQTSVFERFYIVPALSFLLGDGFVTTGSLSDRIAGFDSSIGLTIGMRSPVGPIALNISRAERTSRANVYFSLGYRF